MTVCGFAFAVVFLVAVICFPPCALAYDWQMVFDGNVNYQEEEMLEYERRILDKVSGVLAKLKLPASSQFQLEISEQGYPTKVEVLGDFPSSPR